MSLFLIILAFVVVLVAMIGSIVPAVPGVVFAYLALWIAKWSGYVEFSGTFMWIMAGVTVVVFFLDYFLPPLITKRTGGSKYATWGSIIGMLLGIIFTPIGMLLGLLLGAFVGEMIYLDGHPEEKEVEEGEFIPSRTTRAFRAAFGAFLGFLLGTGLKLILCFYVLYKIIASMVE